MSRIPSSILAHCVAAFLLALTASCALPGGPPLPEIADSINATLEPLETVETAPLPGTTAATPRSVTVLGEVFRPGEIALEAGRRLTIVEALSRVGGQNTATAHVSSLVLVRWDRAHNQQLAWTIDARPKYWSDPKTIFLQPYDIVYVPNIPIDDLGHWVNNYFRRLLPIPVSVPLVTIR